MCGEGFRVSMNGNNAMNGLGDSEQDAKVKQGLIPDAVVHVGNTCVGWEGIGAEKYGGVDTLVDVKTLGQGKCYTNVPLRFKSAVEQRQEQVDTEYEKRVQECDKKLGTAPGQEGPVEKVKKSYGVDGKVAGWVMGAYGECSSDVEALADLVATKQAYAFKVHRNMHLPVAKAMFQKRLTQLWGLYAHRAWANLLLSRAAVMSVGSFDDAPGFARGTSEDDFNMEYNHLHPDRGYFQHARSGY